MKICVAPAARVTAAFSRGTGTENKTSATLSSPRSSDDCGAGKKDESRIASMHDGWIFASDGPMVGWMSRSDDVWTDGRLDEGITGE